jgi:glycosyltransferase involved in cell wall biosynthesis
VRRVLILADFYLPGFRAGGPIVSVSRIVQLEAARNEFFIITRDHDLGIKERYPTVLRGRWQPEGPARVRYVNLRSLRDAASTLRSVRGLRPEIVYINSLFSPVFGISGLALTRLFSRRSIILIAPRGELDPGALAIKHRKKALAGPLVKALVRTRRLVWHASSRQEVENISSWLGREERAVVAVDPAAPLSSGSAPPRQPGEALRVVWLSRIVPKKDLLGALRVLSEVHRPMSFTVYGPQEDAAYWKSCLAEVERLTGRIDFVYGGIVQPRDVAAVFRASDVFLFPTRGENFGHVISESLAVGCPVVTSTSTPWGAVLAAGGGMATDDRRAAAEYVDRLAALGNDELAEIRRVALNAYGEWFDEQARIRGDLFGAALEIAEDGQRRGASRSEPPTGHE